MEPLVSVVITTYGRTDFLEKAIKSVVTQTYNNIEIIVVDDNANNLEVRDKVEAILNRFPQCRLIENKKNLGGGLSRNEGIKNARGEFISFLDDDDTYKENRIRRYIDEFFRNESNAIGIIYGYVDAVNSEGEKIGEYKINPSNKPLFQHMCGCLAATSQWMVPKYIFDKVGMFEDTPCKQDSIMLLKILGEGYEPLCVKESLGNYVEHNQGRISGVSQKNITGLNNFHKWCRKYYSGLSESEIVTVECNFAKQLLSLNILIGNRIDAMSNLRILIKNKPLSVDTIKSLGKYIIGKNYIKLIR